MTTYRPNGEFQWTIVIKTEATAPEFLVDSFQHSFPQFHNIQIMKWRGSYSHFYKFINLLSHKLP